MSHLNSIFVPKKEYFCSSNPGENEAFGTSAKLKITGRKEQALKLINIVIKISIKIRILLHLK